MTTPTRLTADDIAMISWLCRAGAATADQLARRFARPRTSVYRRLGWLVRDGLLAYHRPFPTAGVYLPTRHGQALGPLLPVKATVRTITRTHDLTVVDDLIALEQTGHQVVTEREMRHRTRLRAPQPGPDQPRLGAGDRVRLPGGRGWHYPDLVVETDGRRWAIEVELTAKAPRRLRAIISAWAAAPVTQYAGVIYHTSPVALPGVRAAVAATDAEDFVHIRPLTMSAAPPPPSPASAADLPLTLP